MSESVQADIEAAVSQALRGHGDMVVSWVLCAEVIDEDGERGMWALCPPDQKAWESLGLLAHATQREQAAAVALRLDEGDDR